MIPILQAMTRVGEQSDLLPIPDQDLSPVLRQLGPISI